LASDHPAQSRSGKIVRGGSARKATKTQPEAGYVLLFAAAGQLIIQLRQWFS